MLDNVTINQLRAFIAVCDQGSFSGAARKLARAQSAISHAIKALESAFDVELFERNTRKAQLTAAGRSLLPDARAVISRTEEMKNRAGAIARTGVPQVSVAVDAYFPRTHLVDCLRTLQDEFPTAAIDLRITTMQGGEKLVLEKVCALAVTINDVPEVDPQAIERHWLRDVEMVTACAPSHALASMPGPIPVDEFGRHVQVIVTDNQPGAEGTQQGVAGKCQWLVNDLGAKRDLLKAGLGWGHLPWHLVADDLASGQLVELERRAWHIRSLTFVVSQRRGTICRRARRGWWSFLGRLSFRTLAASRLGSNKARQPALYMPNMGINMPNMGIKSNDRVSEAAALYAHTSLSDALFTTTQQRVLGCLFGQPDRSFTISELIQTTGAGSGAVQREVARLAGSGLLTVKPVGNQKRYRADPASPVHAELVSIARKTFGLAAPLRETLAPLAEHIVAAFVYGSVAKGTDTAASDIDLMLVSDALTYADIMAALHPMIERFGREIHPTLYTRAELRKRVAAGNSFVTRVLAQPRLWIIGGEHDLAA